MEKVGVKVAFCGKGSIFKIQDKEQYVKKGVADEIMGWKIYGKRG